MWGDSGKQAFPIYPERKHISMLDVFALIVLTVVLLSSIAACVLLGLMPGKIARERNHPQADAIAVCGIWGVLTMGLLLPIAYIWAYTNSADGGSKVKSTESES